MKFVSIKNESNNSKHFYSLSESIQCGLAPDGGLFVPESFPTYKMDDFIHLKSMKELAFKLLKPFFIADQLEPYLGEIIEQTLTFPIPLHHVSDDIIVLELFHGPTGAFKDVGARFLASCMSKLNNPLTILVATSGDTGSAVASAFHNKPNMKAVVLFPKGKISIFQEKQLTCWDNNVHSLRVKSDFDSCQKLVKEAFADVKINKKFNLTSANSINIARLLPQMIYYANASIQFNRLFNRSTTFIIPTGNMGNVLACIWVKIMGFPIDKIIITTNENKSIPEYFRTKTFTPRPSISTLANAMDVGNPSNMHRYLHLVKAQSTNSQIENSIHAYSVTDQQIQDTITSFYKKWKYVCCPHSATAVYIQQKLGIKNAIIVSTAHPSKFSEIVEPLIQVEIEIPELLKTSLNKPSKFFEIEPQLKELEKILNITEAL